MGALVAFPAAAVDACEAGEAQLGLVVLQGLVSHHARARGPGARPSGAHGGPRLVLWEEAQVCEGGKQGVSPTEKVMVASVRVSQPLQSSAWVPVPPGVRGTPLQISQDSPLPPPLLDPQALLQPHWLSTRCCSLCPVLCPENPTWCPLSPPLLRSFLQCPRVNQTFPSHLL